MAPGLVVVLPEPTGMLFWDEDLLHWFAGVWFRDTPHQYVISQLYSIPLSEEAAKPRGQ